MSTLTDTVLKATHRAGQIVVTMKSGVEVRFPVAQKMKPCPDIGQAPPSLLREILGSGRIVCGIGGDCSIRAAQCEVTSDIGRGRQLA